MSRNTLPILLGSLILTTSLSVRASGTETDARSGIPVYRASEFTAKSAFVAVAKTACPKGIAVGQMAPTGSMNGTIEAGDFVLIDRSFPFSDLKKGDIVAFRRDTIVTHRLIGKTYGTTGSSFGGLGCWKTQGDALPAPDPGTLQALDYVGRVAAIIHNDLRLPDADQIGKGQPKVPAGVGVASR